LLALLSSTLLPEYSGADFNGMVNSPALFTHVPPAAQDPCLVQGMPASLSEPTPMAPWPRRDVREWCKPDSTRSTGDG
jgi:hypothetical protein